MQVIKESILRNNCFPILLIYSYISLHKIHQNAGFIWPTYSCTQTECENMRAGSPNILVFGLSTGICRPDKTCILVYFTQRPIKHNHVWKLMEVRASLNATCHFSLLLEIKNSPNVSFGLTLPSFPARFLVHNTCFKRALCRFLQHTSYTNKIFINVIGIQRINCTFSIFRSKAFI